MVSTWSKELCTIHGPFHKISPYFKELLFFYEKISTKYVSQQFSTNSRVSDTSSTVYFHDFFRYALAWPYTGKERNPPQKGKNEVKITLTSISFIASGG